MSAETLRKAASLMRKQAARAAEESGEKWGFRAIADGRAWLEPEHIAMHGYPSTANHVSSWHPALALVVADWLDTAGADLWAHGPLCECGSGCHDCDDDLWQPHVRRALAVARIYLGVSA